MRIRDETPGDAAAIAALVTQAFLTAPHADGTEAAIVDRLRETGRLAVSLVADEEDRLAGHVAFSAVTIDGADRGWFGLGPLAVRAESRRHGIGAALVRAGLARLAGGGASGCVLLGDPAYYARFGFRADPALVLEGVPPEYFLALRLAGPSAAGAVRFDPAFAGQA